MTFLHSAPIIHTHTDTFTHLSSPIKPPRSLHFSIKRFAEEPTKEMTTWDWDRVDTFIRICVFFLCCQPLGADPARLATGVESSTAPGTERKLDPGESRELVISPRRSHSEEAQRGPLACLDPGTGVVWRLTFNTSAVSSCCCLQRERESFICFSLLDSWSAVKVNVCLSVRLRKNRTFKP